MSVKDYKDSKLLVVRSEDKIIGTNNRFTVNLGNTSWTQNIVRVVLKSFSITHVFYNVTSENNTLDYVNSTDGALSAVIPEGQYSTAQLITELKTIMDAQMTDTVTITQDPNTRKIRFVVVGGSTNSYLATSSMANDLGLLTTTPTSADVTFQSLTNFGGVKGINILSNLGNGNGVSSTSINNLINVIPVDVAFGLEIIYTGSDEELDSVEYYEGTKFNNLTMEIGGIYGESLDLPVNHDLYAVFKIYHN